MTGKPSTDPSAHDLLQVDERDAWNRSYRRAENVVFAPTEELVRLVARHVRRRVGLHDFVDVHEHAAGARVLDLGCGIGRHLVYGRDMGFDVYGLDLSPEAVALAVEWLTEVGVADAAERVVEGDARAMPWDDGFFDHAVSTGTLDSMPLSIAVDAVDELARVVKPGGMFYCDLIAPPDVFEGGAGRQEVVQAAFEEGTIQSYFDRDRMDELFRDRFALRECWLVRRDEVLKEWAGARWHMMLQRA